MDEAARKVAVLAIKEKLRQLLDDRQQIERQREELDARLRKNDYAIMDCRSAARLFDIEVEIPEELALMRSIMAQRRDRLVSSRTVLTENTTPRRVEIMRTPH